MTKSEEKLIVFKDLLNNSINQIKIYLSHPEPEMQALIHHFPRIISNTVFDNTSGIDFCVQKVTHKEGSWFNLEFLKKRIFDLKLISKQAKKDLRQKSFKKHKGKYNEELPKIQELINNASLQLKMCQEELSKIGTIDFMTEHVTGREQASKYILDYILQNNLVMDVEKTKEVLKKFCFTIQLEKVGNTHTKANTLLEEIQRGNTTFDGYEDIILKLGYQELLPELRPRFEQAKIELKYFTK